MQGVRTAEKCVVTFIIKPRPGKSVQYFFDPGLFSSMFFYRIKC